MLNCCVECTQVCGFKFELQPIKIKVLTNKLIGEVKLEIPYDHNRTTIKLNLACVNSLVIRMKRIRKTCPCDLYPLTPHFYIVKLGFTGVYFFLIFALKHRSLVLVRTAVLRRFKRVPTIYVLSKNKKNIKIRNISQLFIFTAVKYCSILHRHVCVMDKCSFRWY